MTDRYTIRELAESKGISAPARFALLEMDARLTQYANRIEALETQLEGANVAIREQLDIRATLEAEVERLRDNDVLYYEMPGGIRFPVGKAVRGAEPFTHTEGTTYPVTATITAVERPDND